MNFHVLNSKDITVLDNKYEHEYQNKVEIITLFSDSILDSHALAYNVFKDAKYVVELGCTDLPSGSGFIYTVRVTSFSADENCYNDVHGDDYNDFND